MGADKHVPARSNVPVDGDLGYPPAQYVGPVNGGSPEGRHRRRPADVPVDASYRSQLLVWRQGGRRQVVSPSDAQGSEVAHPWGEPVLVVSAWNPRGEPRTLQQNADEQQVLADRVVDLGGIVRGEVVAVPPDHGWAEQALIVADLDQEEGRELASAFGQAAILAWGARHIRLVPTGVLGAVAQSERAWAITDEPMTCPMRLDERPGEQCTVHGGPWTSGAIHAAAVWQSHRALLTTLLGCDSCSDGSGAVNGPGGGRGAIMLEPPRLGSRHGGYVW
jgi:hypothetical protein